RPLSATATPPPRPPSSSSPQPPTSPTPATGWPPPPSSTPPPSSPGSPPANTPNTGAPSPSTTGPDAKPSASSRRRSTRAAASAAPPTAQPTTTCAPTSPPATPTTPGAQHDPPRPDLPILRPPRNHPHPHHHLPARRRPRPRRRRRHRQTVPADPRQQPARQPDHPRRKAPPHRLRPGAAVTDRIPLDHLTSDQLDHLYERAEQAEAALTRVQHVAALIHAGAPWTANRTDTAARIRAAIAGPGTATAEETVPRALFDENARRHQAAVDRVD